MDDCIHFTHTLAQDGIDFCCGCRDSKLYSIENLIRARVRSGATVGSLSERHSAGERVTCAHTQARRARTWESGDIFSPLELLRTFIPTRCRGYGYRCVAQ